MEMTGEQLVPASQEITWNALNDPEVLKACVPGCESIERISGNDFQVLMVARVGPVSAKFKGKLSLSDIKPPNSYSISFEGQGGAAGFAKGSASVRLSPENSATRLSYDVKANVGGKLAQIGSRLVDGAARKVADDFFRNFNEKLSAAKPADAAHDHPADDQHAEPVPRDPDLPSVSNTTLEFFAAGSLVVYLLSLVVLFD
jgi:carbon monoxide dehydrogenase subunit G